MELLAQAELAATLEELRHKRFPVLDDGHVALVDMMGSDRAICEAARVSYGAGIRKRSADVPLIRYLMRHRHTTPFEMVEFKFHVRVPMDAWRQWIRHRTASTNEYSTRYSEAISERQKVAPHEWRSQSRTNKQGSADSLTADNLETIGRAWLRAEEAGAKAAGSEARSPGEYLSEQEAKLHDHAYQVYQQRLGFGVAREQARKDLPLSTYTEAYWKMDLHNLLHFLGLRMDSHAQQEIRSYAHVIGEQIVAKLVPVTWQAFCDYNLNAVRLTRLDCEVVSRICTACAENDCLIPITTDKFLELHHANKPSENGAAIPGHLARNLGRCRERDECLEKLKRLGIVV